MFNLLERLRGDAHRNFSPQTARAAMAQLVIVALNYRDGSAHRSIARGLALRCIRKANEIKRHPEAWESVFFRPFGKECES